MSFQGVTVNRLNGGLNRRTPTNDGVALLVVGSAVATSGLDLKKIVRLLTTKNAEDIGITPSYDDTNNILAHYHIDEFFRLSPDGTLYLLLDDGTLTDAELETLIRENNDIKFFGVVRNSNTAVNLATEIQRYQTICNNLRTDHIQVDGALIEGNQFNVNTLISAYDDLREQNADKVSVVIAQDPVIRALKTEYETHAAVGSVLGMLSVRKVNENLGSVDIQRKPVLRKGDIDYPLTDPARKRFLKGALQNGVEVDGLSEAERKDLTAKGYIYAGSYVGYAGVFFNNAPTCAKISSDYAFIENNRVWNKAARLIRNALMPRIKGNLLKDTQTGFIRSIEATEMEALALRSLEVMISAEEVSGADVYLDPNQQIDENTPLVIKVQLTINNIIHEIDIDLGLTK